MLVKEIMSKNVITIESDDSVFNACMKYKDEKIGCLVVTKSSFCIGIVTERDLIERTICSRKDPDKTNVSDIMSSDIHTINALDQIEKAIDIMNNFKIKKLPVISNDKIVGILTVTDISKARPEISKRFMESWIKPRWNE